MAKDGVTPKEVVPLVLTPVDGKDADQNGGICELYNFADKTYSTTPRHVNVMGMGGGPRNWNTKTRDTETGQGSIDLRGRICWKIVHGGPWGETGASKRASHPIKTSLLS
jgi:hypothetical protein